MAARSMTGSKRRRDGAGEWIFLAPSFEDDAWIAALRATGRPVVLHGEDGAAGGEQGSPLTLVLDTAGFLPAFPGSVLVPDLAGTASATARRYGLDALPGLWVGSRLLAEACALPVERWVVDPGAGADTPLSPDLVVAAPAPDAARPATPADAAFEAAVAEAFGLFSAGPPSVGTRCRWAPSLFSHDRARTGASAVPGTLDVTGRPRILLHGPNFSLPQGRWRILARFEVDAAAARCAFRVEWGDNSEFAFHRFTPGRAGRYQLELSHTWSGPSPAEIRVILETATIDGRLSLEGVELERMA
ncbi:hypothetical protein GVN24_34010 [Rhizobium sp. CRIBSB]|nr:hypothetical protein [Rhizobium sp. CRIBSB]